MNDVPDEPLPEPDRVEGHPHPRETLHLYGQDKAEAQFLAAWHAGRLHHAWMLRGPHGAGKATLAYRIARAVIAQPPEGGLFGAATPPQTLTPPPDCPVRPRILAQSETGLHVLRRPVDPKTRQIRTVITVGEVRGLRTFLQHRATDGGWRAVLVDSADDLNTQAANALLKSLEEPPPRVLFLLIAQSPGALLPTIRSRCRTLDLAALGPEDLGRALDDAGAGVEAEARAALATLSGGSAGQALGLLADDGLALYAAIAGALRDGAGLDRTAALALADAAAGRAAETRFRLTLTLTHLLIARLARAAAGHPPPPADPAEARLRAAVATRPSQAVLWAEAAGTLAGRLRQAVAVNLDPAQTIIDMFLELDTLLHRARALAA